MSNTPLFQLADKSGQWKIKKATSYVPTIAPKTISQTRQDIKNWVDSLNMANNVDQRIRYPLFNLYDNILIDLHLQSQINNRLRKSIAKPFIFKDAKGNIDLELTLFFQNQKFIRQVNKAVLETVYYGHSLGEFDYENGQLVYKLLPRQNIDPIGGFLYQDYSEDKKTLYREQKEYGSWLIEFGDNNDLGLLNGCVPHVLMKRFAQSCHSELCEIYGIPPRVLKTNTQDRTMVSRGEKMLKDMGSAAWFIIDENESFEFAKGVTTNGDVYNSLIKICKDEMSMGISGTVVGQDTKNGSNSKEKTAITILDDLVDSDLSMIEEAWSTNIMASLKAIGIITKDVTYGYPEAQDLELLWKMVVDALPYLEIDIKWIEQTFGIKVTGVKATATTEKLSLNIGQDFFV
jgi:hypothetical protein